MTTTPRTSDSTRRALRTGLDVILTVLTATIAAAVFPGLGDLVDGWTAPGTMAAAGVVCGALLLFFTKLRNALEDRGTIPAVLKAPASDGADPVPPATPTRRGEAGFLDRGLATIVVGIIIGGLLLWLLIELIENASRR